MEIQHYEGIPAENHLHPQPLGIFLRPTHSVPKPSRNPKLNQEMNPTTPCLSRKWQGKVEAIVKLGKTNANDNK